MQKLRLKIKSIEPNGAVVMVPDQTIKVEYVDKSTGKKLTEKEAEKEREKEKNPFLPSPVVLPTVKKLKEKTEKPKRIERIDTKIHPSARLQFIPLAEDTEKYKVGDIYQFELRKVK